MNKNLICSSKDLADIKASLLDRMSIRNMRGKKNNSADGQFDIMLCMGTSCIASGAEKIKTALEAEISKHGLQKKVSIHTDSCPSADSQQKREKVEIVETGCNGFCAMGPIMLIYPGGYFY